MGSGMRSHQPREGMRGAQWPPFQGRCPELGERLWRGQGTRLFVALSFPPYRIVVCSPIHACSSSRRRWPRVLGPDADSFLTPFKDSPRLGLTPSEGVSPVPG